MGKLKWMGSSFLVLILYVALINAQDDDIRGPYCAQQNNCCYGRQDHCAVPILGTLCYCDDFCNSTDIGHNDCCPDYWSFCRGIETTTRWVPTTIRPPAEFRRCEHKGVNFVPGQVIRDNCNVCQCIARGEYPVKECENNVCLLTEEIINGVNENPSRLWRAANYSQFWGETLQRGIDLRLGTLRPDDVVMRMEPVIKTYDPSALPRFFDAGNKWPGYISPIVDQGWCGSSWALSTASVTSDRYAIISRGVENVRLSAQNILSCDKINMLKKNSCKAGHLDRAWFFVKKFGLVDEECFPYTPYYKNCDIGRDGLLTDAGCAEPANPERIHRYSVAPAVKLRNETDIMYEMLNSGPVQATLRVYHDFFSYSEGIYSHTNLDRSDSFGYHSVKIVGWGEEDNRKYWKIANSWGTDWGEDGYFRIARGTNECEIEKFVLSVWPKVDKLMNANMPEPN